MYFLFSSPYPLPAGILEFQARPKPWSVELKGEAHLIPYRRTIVETAAWIGVRDENVLGPG